MTMNNSNNTDEKTILGNLIMRKHEIRTCFSYTQEEAAARLDEVEKLEKMLLQIIDS